MKLQISLYFRVPVLTHYVEVFDVEFIHKKYIKIYRFYETRAKKQCQIDQGGILGHTGTQQKIIEITLAVY